MPPSCTIVGGFAIGALVALLWRHNENRSYKLASTSRYDNIVRRRNVSECSVLAVCLVTSSSRFWIIPEKGWSWSVDGRRQAGDERKDTTI